MREQLLTGCALCCPNQIQDSFEAAPAPLRPAAASAQTLVAELLADCSTARHPDARELARVLHKPHVRTLLETHDAVADHQLEAIARHTSATTPTAAAATASATASTPSAGNKRHHKNGTSNPSFSSGSLSTGSTTTMPSETIKMVGLRRNPNEPLGLTVELDEHDQLMVARILAGGMIDRQGLLHPGDVILEVNGVPVATPEQLQDQISLAKESLTLKIGPSVDEEMKSARLTMSGGQVKNGRNLDTGKKLTVSVFFSVLCFCFLFGCCVV